MFKNYFRIAWRILLRNKSFSIINISGLSVAMAACILIGLFVNNEQSFDKNIPCNNNKFRLNEYVHYDGGVPQMSAAIGPPIAPFLKEKNAFIQSYTRVFPATPDIYPTLTLEYNNRKFSAGKIVCTDTSFCNFFGAAIVDGDKKNFLLNQNTIVLTQRIARKIFGSSSPINKTIVIHTSDSTIINAAVSNVIADMPGNSHLQVDALLPVPGFHLESNYGVLLGPAYLQLMPGANVNALQAKFTNLIHERNKFIDMRLQRVADIHSKSTDISYDFFNDNKIDGKYVNIFIIIALAIFLLACINFINLSVAAAAYRGKEIAVKKIAGANRFQLIVQVLTETFLVIFVTVLLSIFLAALVLPYLNYILHRSLQVSILYQPGIIAFYLVILVGTTLLAGLYPAVSISSVNINAILKSKLLTGSSQTSLRNVLVTAQFSIAVIFIISLIIIIQQLQYLQSKDLGYAYSQVINVPIDQSSVNKLPALRAELLKIKGVEGVTNGYLKLGSNGSLFGIDYQSPRGEQKQMSVNFENAGSDYLHFFGMKLIAGNDFEKNNNGNQYMVNETLAKQLGYTNPIGKSINLSGGWPPGVIAGVMKDFNYSSLHSKIEPLIVGNINTPFFQKQLYVKLSTADISSSVKQVENTFKSVSGNPDFSYHFLNDTFKNLYDAERQAETMVAFIGVLAVIIASLGLLSLETFIVLKRTKEIGIRKVLGASVQAIAFMLSKDFLKLVIIAIIISFPLAWWLMNAWLQDFAYRIIISPVVFVIAALIVIAVTIVAISFQTIKAAIANPVKSLRTE